MPYITTTNTIEFNFFPPRIMKKETTRKKLRMERKISKTKELKLLNVYYR